ncbi:MAG: MerR family transcriptional regulator [Acidobacteriota bacterium]|nr:MerR family transcriptional regulator [Acidobacteriota bacterium]
MEPNRYPIRAAARLSGLSVDTLRAWERRYRAVEPERGPRGRLYTEAHVARLRLLRQAVDAGFAIGLVAAQPDADLQSLVAAGPSQPRHGTAADPAVPALRAAVLDAVQRFDFQDVEATLGRAALLMPARELVYDVVLPLLRQVGEAWHEGRLHVAHEHMLSAVVQRLLGTLLRQGAGHRNGPRLIVATPAGERHEFGILAASLLAVGRGVDVTYLGVDLPAVEVLHVVARLRPAAVLLGVTRETGHADSVADAAYLAKRLPAGVRLWIGGPQAAALAPRLPHATARPLDSFEALETALAELEPRP